jgi:hypothetical protein
MGDRCTGRDFERISRIASERVRAVIRCIDVLLPGIDVRRKKRIANRILTLCDGKDRSVTITQLQAQEIILPHLQCISRNCPMLCAWEPISRSLNEFFSEDAEWK